MHLPLAAAVIRTVAYFHHFRYPLTAFEIWKWLLEPGELFTLSAVVHELSVNPVLQKYIIRDGAYYGFGDVAQQVAERHHRFLDATRKYRKAFRISWWLGRLPWLEGAAVCNSLAWRHTTPESDIDLFIVSAAGRVWSARFLATLPAILLRQRPGEILQDPLCLSFFATRSALDFEKLKIAEQDPYLAYWCYSLVPLVERTGWQQQLEQENVWLARTLPNAWSVKLAHRFRWHSRLRIPWIPFSEPLARALQVERFPERIRDLMNKDSRVVVSDTMLKFHENDRRLEIAQALERTAQNVLSGV